MLAASSRTAGRGRFLGRVFFADGTAATAGSSAEGACSVGAVGFGLGGLEAVLRSDSAFFSSAAGMGVRICSQAGVCSGAGVVFCFSTVATVCDFDSAFFFFGF